MAIPEVDKSLTKALREIPEKGKSENGRINLGDLWWAWVDLNHRPRPYQGSAVRFYNLQDRGDCQTARKSYKTAYIVGYFVGWKTPRPPKQPPHSFPRTPFLTSFRVAD